MNRAALAFPVVVALGASAASAALDLRIGPNAGADQVDAFVAPGSGEHFFDLAFNATGFNESFNELLFAYDVELVAETTRPGLRLLRVEKPDNWVFTAPDATLEILEADADRILAEGVDSRARRGSDIVTGSEVARLFYAADAGAAPGLYRIASGRSQTVFVSGNPDCSCGIYPDITDPGVVRVTPEPSGLALLAAAGLLLSRQMGRAVAR